jgi:hypothetical protein
LIDEVAIYEKPFDAPCGLSIGFVLKISKTQECPEGSFHPYQNICFVVIRKEK